MGGLGVFNFASPVSFTATGIDLGTASAGVLIDLDEHDIRGVEIILSPLGGDQDVGTCHGGDPFDYLR